MKKALKILIIIAIVIVLFFLIFPFPEGCFKEDPGELVLSVTFIYYKKSENHIIEYNSIVPAEIKELDRNNVMAVYRLNKTSNKLIIKLKQCEDPRDISISTLAYYSKSKERCYDEGLDIRGRLPESNKPGVYTYNFSHPEWEEDKVVILEILEDNVEE